VSSSSQAAGAIGWPRDDQIDHGRTWGRAPRPRRRPARGALPQAL